MNEWLKDRINTYILRLNEQGREVDEIVLCELIKQWAFDYRVES